MGETKKLLQTFRWIKVRWSKKFLGNWTQTSMGNKKRQPFEKPHSDTRAERVSGISCNAGGFFIKLDYQGIPEHHYIQLKAMKQMKQWTISHQLLHPDFSGWGNWEQRPPSPFLSQILTFLTNLKSVKRMYWGQWWGRVRGSQIKPQWKRTGKLWVKVRGSTWVSSECLSQPASEIILVEITGPKALLSYPSRKGFLRACPIVEAISDKLLINQIK